MSVTTLRKIEHKRYEYGEFAVSFRYLNGDPYMVIASRDDRTWCVIDQRNAWRYADPKTGAPTRRLIATACDYAERLGLFAARDTVFRIAGAIVDALPDLIEMPPWERYAASVPTPDTVGEAVITVGGQRFSVDVPASAVEAITEEAS